MSRDIPQDRIDEITTWLQKPVTLEQACEALDAEDANVFKPKLTLIDRLLIGLLYLGLGVWIFDLFDRFRRFRSGPELSSADSLSLWLNEYDLTSVELWEYDTGNEAWQQLAGECGYAIVADGRVIDFWMTAMN